MTESKSRCARTRPALLLLSFISLALAGSWNGKVVGVSDGDTITVMHENRAIQIRLHGIDCPEGGQPFGTKAKQFASSLVFDRIVHVEPVERDRYGRLVATVHLRDGRVLNHELVRNGFAWWYRQYAPDDSVLASLEKEARAGWRGLWGEKNPIPPWEWRDGEWEHRTEMPAAKRGPPDPDAPSRQILSNPSADDLSATSQEFVYRTSSGKRYHRGACRHLKSRIPTTVAHASAMGLAPCSVCRPPSPGATLSNARLPQQ